MTLVVKVQAQVYLPDGTTLMLMGADDTVVNPHIDDVAGGALLARGTLRELLERLIDDGSERLGQLSVTLQNIADADREEEAQPDD